MVRSNKLNRLMAAVLSFALVFSANPVAAEAAFERVVPTVRGGLEAAVIPAASNVMSFRVPRRIGASPSFLSPFLGERTAFAFLSYEPGENVSDNTDSEYNGGTYEAKTGDVNGTESKPDIAAGAEPPGIAPLTGTPTDLMALSGTVGNWQELYETIRDANEPLTITLSSSITLDSGGVYVLHSPTYSISIQIDTGRHFYLQNGTLIMGAENAAGGNANDNITLTRADPTVATAGGGVQTFIFETDRHAHFIMRGGTITGNRADTAMGGGGVSMNVMDSVAVGSAIFTMHGGTISDNFPGPNDNGGGVHMGGRSTFNYHGGTISGNTGHTDGTSNGISIGGAPPNLGIMNVHPNSTLVVEDTMLNAGRINIMSGGTMTNNSTISTNVVGGAAENSGRIFIAQGGTLINGAGATFNAGSRTSIFFNEGTIRNHGTIVRRSGGAAVARIHNDGGTFYSHPGSAIGDTPFPVGQGGPVHISGGTFIIVNGGGDRDYTVIEHAVTYGVEDGYEHLGSLTATNVADGYAREGVTVIFTAAPNTGYEAGIWTAVDIYDEPVTLNPVVNQPNQRSLVITQTVHVEVSFEQIVPRPTSVYVPPGAAAGTAPSGPDLAGATRITADTAALGAADTTTWYFVHGEVEGTGRMAVNGHANIVLADNANLIVDGGIHVDGGNTLTIWSVSGEGVDWGSPPDSMGTLAAKGGNQQTGIGGNVHVPYVHEGETGTIIINGGDITAQGGGDAAGIGRSSGGIDGIITINAGRVAATGGVNAAGIGSAGWGNPISGGTTVTIRGGYVTAQGGHGGAGIGGGSWHSTGGGHGGIVNIHGGTVTADAGTVGGGAGIGGGAGHNPIATGGHGGTVNIHGGTVTATGVQDGAGIGGGGAGTGGDYRRGGGGGIVNIHGGNITATSGFADGGNAGGGAAIGGGSSHYSAGGDSGGGAVINVLGNAVLAARGDGIGRAIGGGVGGTEANPGTLTIASGMTLTLRTNAPNPELQPVRTHINADVTNNGAVVLQDNPVFTSEDLYCHTGNISGQMGDGGNRFTLQGTVWPGPFNAFVGQILANVAITGGTAPYGFNFAWVNPTVSVGVVGQHGHAMYVTRDGWLNYNNYVTADVTVNVTAFVPVTAITVQNTANLSFMAGQNLALSALGTVTVEPGNASFSTVTWEVVSATAAGAPAVGAFTWPLTATGAGNIVIRPVVVNGLAPVRGTDPAENFNGSNITITVTVPTDRTLNTVTSNGAANLTTTTQLLLTFSGNVNAAIAEGNISLTGLPGGRTATATAVNTVPGRADQRVVVITGNWIQGDIVTVGITGTVTGYNITGTQTATLHRATAPTPAEEIEIEITPPGNVPAAGDDITLTATLLPPGNDASEDNIVWSGDIDGTPVTGTGANITVTIPENECEFSRNFTVTATLPAADNPGVGALTKTVTIIQRGTTTTFIITFNPNGGTVTPAFDETGADGRLASLPTPTRSGHTFAGWYTELTGGVRVTTATVFTEDATIYARWTPIGGGLWQDFMPAPTFNLTETTAVINDGSLTAVIGTTGTAAGDMTFDRGNLPPEITLRQDGNNIIVTATRPAHGRGAISGTFTFTVIRGGLRRTIELQVRLTPQDGPAPTPAPMVRVTFDPNGGYVDDSPLPAVMELSPGSNIPYDLDAERDRYWFAGWFIGDYRLTADSVAEYDITVTAGWKATFDDVNPPDWFYNAVRVVAVEGLFVGTDYRIFEPYISMSRVMFSQVLANLAGVDTSPLQWEDRFIDVTPGNWYSGAVNWVARMGICPGIGGGQFAPHEPITREGMAAMLYNFASVMGIRLPRNPVSPFSDQDQVSPWAEHAVRAIQAAGIIQGHGNGFFNPRDTVRRAEVAAIFAMYLQVVHDVAANDITIPTAVPGIVLAEPQSTSAIRHTVVNGDSLWNLAERYLGDPQRWPEIQEFNRLPTREIQIGQRLLIP